MEVGRTGNFFSALFVSQCRPKTSVVKLLLTRRRMSGASSGIVNFRSPGRYA